MCCTSAFSFTLTLYFILLSHSCLDFSHIPPLWVIWLSQFLYPFSATKEPRPSGNLKSQPDIWFLES